MASSSVTELVRAVYPAMVALRRDLHANPELGWSEHRTTRKVAEQLIAWGLEPVIRAEGTGLTVDIGSGERAVGFRADIDALPISEANNVRYRSLRPEIMHACGHDAHTAIGLGIAGVLKDLPDLGGRVRIVFQPAEEQIPGGAVAMMAAGALEGLSSILAFHVDPSLAPGRVGLRRGGITGASDRFILTLHGPGGHTSRPHQSVDLVYAAARVVTDLPGLLRYGVDPREPMAVVFGRIEGGTAENVIPSVIELGGTVRLFNLELWRAMGKELEQHVRDLVAPLGATADVIYEQGAPPVVNDGEIIDMVERAAADVLGTEGVTGTHQSLGAEDFAWYLESIPGALVRLGAALPDRQVDLHSTTFDIDESCIEHGIAVGVASLLEMLK